MVDGALDGEENHEVKVPRAIFICGIEKVRSVSFFGSRLPEGNRTTRATISESEFFSKVYPTF
jgi:hypothetical protein